LLVEIASGMLAAFPPRAELLLGYSGQFRPGRIHKTERFGSFLSIRNCRQGVRGNSARGGIASSGLMAIFSLFFA